ncbi:YrdB family protein [Compostimonas suwonensis]|uniref:Uncharacterized protein DUF2568 n=1 Tax=Compostimonas suwonensis TaxID=1048394 RepID=A0A2M9BVC8_9MICO|nr:YrdB family protein [Compostimonas suwonensis]PJJ61909.1 uncharacterized protein DUF2568 [Compostimonas suwonensis]
MSRTKLDLVEQQQRQTPAIGAGAVLRFVLELFAFFSLGFWGFVAWPFAWNILAGIATPAFAILLWALFVSPKAVVHLDPFGRALVEIFVMGAAALSWWSIGQPIIALVFGVVAAVSGVLSGRKAYS